MTDHKNAQGQPIGAPVADWTGCDNIPHTPMQGHFCDVVPLSMDHSRDLHTAFQADETGTLWTYMPVGLFGSQANYDAWVTNACDSQDPLFFTVIDKETGRAVGVASFLRIQPENGVAEVGYITFSPALKQTPMATEAMFLMMKRIFDDFGYRRYEWKCDALAERSFAQCGHTARVQL